MCPGSSSFAQKLTMGGGSGKLIRSERNDYPSFICLMAGKDEKARRSALFLVGWV
jgi:hypothetical protein